jgi:hypothetical protein
MTTIRRCSMVAWLLAAAVCMVAAQESFRLVSAQVVTRSDGPPSLKFAASGPIAFHVLAANEGGETAPNKVKARLYGVVPGDLSAAGVAPYAIATHVDGQDTILTVIAPANQKIELKAALKSNEIVVVAVANP